MALIQKLGHGLPAHNSTSVYLDYLSFIACHAVGIILLRGCVFILLVFDRQIPSKCIPYF